MKKRNKQVVTLSVTLRKKHINRLLVIVLLCSNLVSHSMLLCEKVHLGAFTSTMEQHEEGCSLKGTDIKG